MNKPRRETVSVSLSNEEAALRLSLSDLIDEAFEAYLETGHTLEDYAKTQWFLNLLFQTANSQPVHGLKRLQALRFCEAFMVKLCAHYRRQTAELKREGPREQKRR